MPLPPPSGSIVADRLAQLVGVLVDHPGPPLLAGLADLASVTPTFVETPLLTHDPVTALFGRHAPDEWDGVAFRAAGRTERGPTTLTVGLAVTRGGAAALAVAAPGRPTTVDATPTAELRGHVADACRRILGLANPPPSTSTTELLARWWLDAVAEQAADGAELSWDRIARLHPAVDVVAAALGVDGPRAGRLAVDHLPVVGRLVAEVWPWDRLRTEIAHGDTAVLGVTPAAAAWMDDGMFSRWVVGRFPAREDLDDLLTATLPPFTFRRIERVLAAWDGLRSEADREAPPPSPA